jgi:transposase-like protein
MAKDIANVPAPNELADFETEYVPVQVLPIRWSVEKYQAAQMFALEGKTKTAIAKELGISVAIINSWLKIKEFQDYVDSLVMEKATLLKAKKLRLLTKALDAREEQAELTGYGDITKKDTLDIIAEIRKETGEEKTAETSYTNLLERMVVNAMKNQPKIINLGGE